VGPAGWVPSLIESSGDFVQGWLCLSFVLGWPLLFCSAFERRVLPLLRRPFFPFGKGSLVAGSASVTKACIVAVRSCGLLQSFGTPLACTIGGNKRAGGIE